MGLGNVNAGAHRSPATRTAIERTHDDGRCERLPDCLRRRFRRGLDAYIRLFRHLPNDMGVAVVIVNHLRTVAALLPEILLRYTGMPVSLIAEGLPVTPNRVFMIPEKRDRHVCDGAFQLKPMSKHRGGRTRDHVLPRFADSTSEAPDRSHCFPAMTAMARRLCAAITDVGG